MSKYYERINTIIIKLCITKLIVIILYTCMASYEFNSGSRFIYTIYNIGVGSTLWLGVAEVVIRCSEIKWNYYLPRLVGDQFLIGTLHLCLGLCCIITQMLGEG